MHRGSSDAVGGWGNARRMSAASVTVHPVGSTNIAPLRVRWRSGGRRPGSGCARPGSRLRALASPPLPASSGVVDATARVAPPNGEGPRDQIAWLEPPPRGAGHRCQRARQRGSTLRGSPVRCRRDRLSAAPPDSEKADRRNLEALAGFRPATIFWPQQMRGHPDSSRVRIVSAPDPHG